MQSRLAGDPTVAERSAAWAIRELAGEIQDARYYSVHAYGESCGLPPATRRALDRTYRVLRTIVQFYFGDDHPLVWDPPSGRFQPKAKKGTK
jgi:hypothetical protein